MRTAARIAGVLIGLFALYWLFNYGLGLVFSDAIPAPPGKDTAWVLLVALAAILIGTVAVGLARVWGAVLIAGTLIAVWVWGAVVAWTSYEGGAGFLDDLVALSPPLLIAAVAALGVAFALSRTRAEP